MCAREKFSLGLVGHPVHQSLSPEIHHAFLQATGLSGQYQLYSLPPDDRSESTFRSLLMEIRENCIDGLNVTLPYKQFVIRWLDSLTDNARETGAVNTIYLKGSELFGENTDIDGFLQDLARVLPSSTLPIGIDSGRTRHALILGAGGAARGAVLGLLKNQWHVYIAARRQEIAVNLLKDIQAISTINNLESSNCEQYTAVKLNRDVIQKLIAQNQIDLIVNATPVGMVGNIVDETPWPKGLPFPPTALVYDMVYNPLVTRLVADARKQGLVACTGRGMLIRQASLSFKVWTGIDVPNDLLDELTCKQRETI